MTIPVYPTCSTCGHHASGVVAGVCTNLVLNPEGDSRGIVGYCGCRCIDDPVIREWLGPEAVARIEASPLFHRGGYTDG